MSIQLITGFTVNNSTPLDNRIVASGSTARNSIPYKYEGMRVYDSSNGYSYVWTSGSFQSEKTDQIIGSSNYVPKFTSTSKIGNSSMRMNGDALGIAGNVTGVSTLLQIGSENPSTNSAGPLLFHVGGGAVIGNNWYYNGTGNSYFNLNNGSSKIDFYSSGAMALSVRRASGPIGEINTPVIFIQNDKNIGIGKDDPQYKLDVVGDIKSSANIISQTVTSEFVTIGRSETLQSKGLELYDSTLGTEPASRENGYPPDGQGLFIDWSSNLDIENADRSYFAGISGYSKKSGGGELRFYTTNLSTINTPGNYTSRPVRMVIDRDGKVGINTTSPMSGSQFQVVGTSVTGGLIVGSVSARLTTSIVNTINGNNFIQIGELDTVTNPSNPALPLVIHRGGSAVIGYNWYFTGASTPSYVGTWSSYSFGSSYISLDKGSLSFVVRPASTTSFNTVANVSSTGLELYDSTPGTVPVNPPRGSLDVFPNNGYPPDGQGLFIDFSSNLELNGNKTYFAGISGYSDKETGGGDLRFYTTNVSTYNTVGNGNRPVRMTIKNDGKIGIGTTSPSEVLHVSGNIKTTGSLYIPDNTTRISTSNDGMELWSDSFKTILLANQQVRFRDGSMTTPSIAFQNVSEQFGAPSTGIYRLPFITYTACVDPDTNILVQNNNTIKAKDLKVGDYIYTIHESKKTWGNYRVTYAQIVDEQNKLEIILNDLSSIRVSDGHRFLMSNDDWKEARELLVDEIIKGINSDKTIVSISKIEQGSVVKIEVEDAHTYVSNELISHNAKDPITTYSKDGIGFTINGTNRMVIRENGVGVGYFSSDDANSMPTATLDVNGTMRLRSSGAPTNADDGEIYFNGTNLFLRVGVNWKQIALVP